MNSRITYTGDGETATFPVPVYDPILSHIVVTIDGETYPNPVVINGSVTLSPTPEIGAEVIVKRVTLVDSKIVTFRNGTILNADYQNRALTQLFHRVQELTDDLAVGIIGLKGDKGDTGSPGVGSDGAQHVTSAGGVIDQATEINAAIQAAINSDVILDGGTYRVTQSIIGKTGVNLILRGGATITTANNSSFNVIEMSPGFTVNGGVIDVGSGYSGKCCNADSLCGFPAYNAATTYAQNTVIAYNGVQWQSKVSSNINHTPANGSYWNNVGALYNGSVITGIFNIKLRAADYVSGSSAIRLHAHDNTRISAFRIANVQVNKFETAFDFQADEADNGNVYVNSNFITGGNLIQGSVYGIRMRGMTDGNSVKFTYQATEQSQRVIYCEGSMNRFNPLIWDYNLAGATDGKAIEFTIGTTDNSVRGVPNDFVLDYGFENIVYGGKSTTSTTPLTGRALTPPSYTHSSYTSADNFLAFADKNFNVTTTGTVSNLYRCFNLKGQDSAVINTQNDQTVTIDIHLGAPIGYFVAFGVVCHGDTILPTTVSFATGTEAGEYTTWKTYTGNSHPHCFVTRDDIPVNSRNTVADVATHLRITLTGSTTTGAPALDQIYGYSPSWAGRAYIGRQDVDTGWSFITGTEGKAVTFATGGSPTNEQLAQKLMAIEQLLMRVGLVST